MCDHADKKQIPDTINNLTKRRSSPPLSKTPTAPLIPAVGSRFPQAPNPFASARQRLKPVLLPPKLTLYGESILYSHELVETLIKITSDSIASEAATLHAEKLNTLRHLLDNALAPAHEIKTEPEELLNILFEKLKQADIPLSPSFLNDIKRRCKDHVLSMRAAAADPACSEISTFLAQWSNPGLTRQPCKEDLTRYQFADAEQARQLFSTDEVSTTTDPHAITARANAADRLLGWIDSSAIPLTKEDLQKKLLELNEIYSPPDVHSYKHGFRYHTEQIGQGDNAVGTTSPINVESAVGTVIDRILTNLAPCEAALMHSQTLADNLLKTVISTAAMAYQLLISIHPFADGNGRTCRMFANYILMRYHLLPATFSQDDAKLSMYEKENDFSSGNSAYPDKARSAMMHALERSADALTPKESASSE